MPTQMSDQFYRIGYALSPETEKKTIKISLIDHAKQRGLHLIRIDQSMPLLQQGPFHCIIHKLYGQDWKNQLQQFSSENPHVPIIDPPESIARLHNRVSMLEVVKKLRINGENESFGIPNQIAIFDSDSLIDPCVMESLKFPVIAKPIEANGSDQSHKMKLIFNSEGLKTLRVPMVLQEFVNHGGVIFKVYVMGEYVECVKRNSLPDIALNTKTLEKSVSFSKVSEELSNAKRAEMPAWEFVREMARGLREEMGIKLFNFDMIRDGNGRYIVIDINYFPGYAKMTSYESVFTDFLLDVVVDKNNNKEIGNDEEATMFQTVAFQ